MEFEQFVRTEMSGLLRYATALCGGRQQAEDVLQEVLTRAAAQWGRIQQAEASIAYVRRMITNEFLSVHRKWGRIVPRAEVSTADTAPDPAVRTADRMMLLDELRRLPRKQRAVLVLRYYGGLTDNEIAADLNCSPATVRGYASRALASLRVDLVPTSPLRLAGKDTSNA